MAGITKELFQGIFGDEKVLGLLPTQTICTYKQVVSTDYTIGDLTSSVIYDTIEDIKMIKTKNSNYPMKGDDNQPVVNDIIFKAQGILFNELTPRVGDLIIEGSTVYKIKDIDDGRPVYAVYKFLVN